MIIDMSPQSEKILVLYGSQMGTSEKVAQSICDDLAQKLNDDSNDQESTSPIYEAVGPTQLDDFLQEPAWTRMVIIVVSSFGVGYAPMGARKFRKLCDYWTATLKDCPDGKPLHGLQFALCGLGDSKFSSYMANPLAICQGLQTAGAQLVGDKGAIDASAGSEQQQAQIDEWKETSLWPALKEISALRPILSDEELAEMSKKTFLP